MPKVVANILCHNDLVYLQNLIPQVAKIVDRIIVVDDCSEDGTKEWLAKWSIVEVIERKFDLNFSNQRNAALEMVDNEDWVFRIDSDELPTKQFRDLLNMIPYFESSGTNQIIVPIYHLINFSMCKTEVGMELRLFKKNETCVYLNKFHEVIHGNFGIGKKIVMADWLSLVHFKYADKSKIDYTKDFFVKNELYDQEDLNRRLNMEATFLPYFVTYEINDILRKHLCSNSI